MPPHRQNIDQAISQKPQDRRPANAQPKPPAMGNDL
jgi:hypothetical protein